MTFTRYEIRWYFGDNCGVGDFTYTPFDSVVQAKDYAKKHKEECEVEGCGLYKIILHSNYDEPILLKDFFEYQRKKELVRYIAMTMQEDLSEGNVSLNKIIEWQDYLTKKARKYGLIKEFKENGIL